MCEFIYPLSSSSLYYEVVSTIKISSILVGNANIPINSKRECVNSKISTRLSTGDTKINKNELLWRRNTGEKLWLNQHS